MYLNDLISLDDNLRDFCESVVKLSNSFFSILDFSLVNRYSGHDFSSMPRAIITNFRIRIVHIYLRILCYNHCLPFDFLGSASLYSFFSDKFFFLFF